MKKLLLKSMLLLCALIVGSSSVWAASVTLDLSSATGWTISKAGTSGSGSAVEMSKDGFTITANKGYWTGSQLRVYSGSSFVVTSAIGNMTRIVLTYADDKNGPISNYSSGAANISPAAETLSGTASGQARITQIVVTLEGSGTSYTITAESNNNEWGTVELSGTTITATPASGYQVSTSTPYEVTSGTATVVQSGNDFDVTPESDCTILINFEVIPTYTITINEPENGTLSVRLKSDNSVVNSGAQHPAGTVLIITATPNEGYNFKNIQVVDPTTHTFTTSIREYTLLAANTTIKANFTAKVYHKVTFSVNGDASNQANVEEGESIVFPANPLDLGGKTFMGWAETPIVGTTDDAPSFVSSATMGTEDVTYYAVYATVAGLTPASWTETALDAMSTSDIFVFSDGSYAIPNDNGTTSAPAATAITVSEGKITSTVADNLKWQVSGNSTDGYTFYPSGTTETWLYCSTTASSKNNDNIRVGTGARKVWEFSNAGYLVTNDTYTDRYLSNYNNQDFRGYVNTENGAFVPKFYKYVAPSGTYSAYCTAIKENITVSTAGLATFASDSKLDFTNVENLEAYIAKENGSTIELEKVNKVPAGTGVLLRALNNVTDFNVPLTAADADDVTDNLFVRGTGAAVASVDGSHHNYILSKKSGVVGFYQANGKTVATNRAYLQTTTDAARIDLNFDETTAIETVKTQQADGQYFNLAGQRVVNPTKGLYIVNGKKVTIK